VKEALPLTKAPADIPDYVLAEESDRLFHVTVARYWVLAEGLRSST
jgi:hypothetical protein